MYTSWDDNEEHSLSLSFISLYIKTLLFAAACAFLTLYTKKIILINRENRICREQKRNKKKFPSAVTWNVNKNA